MYNNNYWILRAYGEGKSAPNNYAILDIGLKNKSDENQQIYVIGGNASNPQYGAPWNIALVSRLVVGTGTTAATAADVDLEEDVTSSFSNLARSCTTAADGESLKTNYEISGVNSTEAPITISEIGIETLVKNPSNVNVYILTARKVFSEPMTVGAGASFSLTVTATTK